MEIEIVCHCENIADLRDIFEMCLECYQDKIHKLNKVDYSFILDGFKIKFVTPYTEQMYLQGRRNVVLTDTCHVRPFLVNEIERRKNEQV